MYNFFVKRIGSNSLLSTHYSLTIKPVTFLKWNTFANEVSVVSTGDIVLPMGQKQQNEDYIRLGEEPPIDSQCKGNPSIAPADECYKGDEQTYPPELR